MATLNFPDNPSTGDKYTDSNSGFTYEWDGTVWKSSDPSTASNIREIDDISSGFNGSTTAFTLQVASVNVEPANVQQLIISVGGVMQNAGDDYTVSGSTITFTTAPSSGLTFFGTLLGTALSLNTVADGSVTVSSLSTTTNYIMGGLTADQNAGIITSYGLVAGAGGVNVSGAVTGGSFSGDGSGLTGVASTDNIITSYGATFLSNVRVAGIFTAANAYVTGILTAQTLNYNNVVDIYSTGIITATRGIQQTGNEGLHVSSGITTVGIFTATKSTVGLAVTINNTGIDAGIGAGIITAKEFYGDASNMTGAGSSLTASGFVPVPLSETQTAISPQLSIMFNQGVKAGSGELTLKKDTAGGTTVQSFGVGSSVTYVHGQAIVSPDDLVNDQKYYLCVPDSGIQNMAGSSNIGAINEYYFTTKPYVSKMYGCGHERSFGGNTNNEISSPVQVGSEDNWALMAGHVTSESGFAINNSGELYAWGSQSLGQLGLNNTDNYYGPTQVGTDTNWKDMSVGSSAVLGLKKDGTLWSWGYNRYGQLGQNQSSPGSSNSRSSPTQVGTESTWSRIGCSYHASYAVKTDGTFWSWGYHTAGQLGQGNNTQYSSPTQIGTDTTWVGPSRCGYMHMLATKTDGTLWTWGYNASGELGQNNKTNYSSPRQVGTDTNWATTYQSNLGGYYRSFAIKTTGELFSWGENNDGVLGHNNQTEYSSPRQVPGSNYSAVANTQWSTSATKTNKQLWTWGKNQKGEIGDNDNQPRMSPGRMGSLSHWGNIAGHKEAFSWGTKKPQ